MIKKERILVYGIGKFYFENETRINEQYSISAYIDNNKKGSHLDKVIISLEEVTNYEYDIILVMIQDIQSCFEVVRELIYEKAISCEKIVLGHSKYGMYGEVLDKLVVLPDGNIELTVGNISVKVHSLDEFNNTCEVLVNGIYDYYINNGKKDVVIDIGMNIADSTCFFLDRDNVSKVYGYEPFKETFLQAKENLSKYTTDEERFEIFQYGLSDENRMQTSKFNTEWTCGQCTISEIRDKNLEMYEAWGLAQSDKEEEENIEIRKASDVLLPIFIRHQNENIVLKMDCEGEEYAIIRNLSEQGLLGKFSFIMLEWHYKGNGELIDKLLQEGFSYWCMKKNSQLGFIYAYK